MAEKIEMSQITTEIDEVYNDSGKYVTFDEQGNSIDDGRSVTAQNHQNADAVQYTLITEALNKPDDKYVNISETGKIAQNITASGATYALPYKSNVTQAEIEDDEKYERRDNVNTIAAGNVKVAHNTTESGVAYAVPYKSGAKPRIVVADKDDDKYMMIEMQNGNDVQPTLQASRPTKNNCQAGRKNILIVILVIIILLLILVIGIGTWLLLSEKGKLNIKSLGIRSQCLSGWLVAATNTESASNFQIIQTGERAGRSCYRNSLELIVLYYSKTLTIKGI